MDEDRHNPKLSRISLFVSSPGDVAHERRVARETIARLNAEFADRIVLDAYFWEYERFDFSKSFQEQIPNTATFDVVLCLLWSRLGSRLGPRNGFPTAHRRTRAPSMKSRMLLSARRSVMGCQNCTSGSTRRFHRFSRSRRRSTTKGSLSGALSRDSSSNGQRTVRTARSSAPSPHITRSRIFRISSRLSFARSPRGGWPSRRGRLRRPRSAFGQSVHHFAVSSLSTSNTHPSFSDEQLRSAVRSRLSAKRSRTKTIPAVSSWCSEPPARGNPLWHEPAFFRSSPSPA